MTETSRKSLVAVPLTLALAVICAAGSSFAVWKWQDARWNARLVTERETAARSEAGVREQAERWATAVARKGAEGIFRGFLAGIQPALLAEQHESLRLAAVGLLRVEGVAALHILRPDSTVLYSSDAKYATMGHGDDRAAWALSAGELTQRESSTPDVIEIVAPVSEGGKVLAVVWLSYRPEKLRDAVKPPGLEGAGLE